MRSNRHLQNTGTVFQVAERLQGNLLIGRETFRTFNKTVVPWFVTRLRVLCVALIGHPWQCLPSSDPIFLWPMLMCRGMRVGIVWHVCGGGGGSVHACVCLCVSHPVLC